MLSERKHPPKQRTRYRCCCCLKKNQNAPRPFVVSHIQRIGCQPEKNYFTRWPIPLVVCWTGKREQKKKSGSTPPPLPTPPPTPPTGINKSSGFRTTLNLVHFFLSRRTWLCRKCLPCSTQQLPRFPQPPRRRQYRDACSAFWTKKTRTRKKKKKKKSAILKTRERKRGVRLWRKKREFLEDFFFPFRSGSIRQTAANGRNHFDIHEVRDSYDVRDQRGKWHSCFV